jgi:PAS domain S-box-containing protein
LAKKRIFQLVMANENSSAKLLALKKIVEETSTFTGRDFFRALVKNLAETLHLHGVWVTEYDPGAYFLRSLAFWLKDHYVPHYDYAVAGTPCEPVIQSKDLFHVPEKVIQLFPKDPDLPPLGAVSYVGVALKSETGEVMGHLAALDNKPMEELPESFAIFKLFAARAEAEMRRLHYERRLIQNEAKVRRLVNGAMNGILEMDEKFVVTQANPSAVKLFGAGELAGKPVKDLLTLAGFQSLLHAAPYLDEDDENKAAAWIPGYVECQKLSGETFYAEASLSKFSEGAHTFYVFFIANVQDRLAAEQKAERLLSETAFLKEELRALANPGQIVGKSDCVQRVCDLVRQAAPTDVTVLITGETGTGKELFARAIHEQSPRRDRTMAAINCAALPPELIESELFGHVKGAFTGALAARDGRFAQADQSTLFLDEVGEMPLPLQAKLLRTLQEGEVQPVGGAKTLKVDVRIVAATNRDLAEAVRKGEFREDLYYRLNVFPIHLPPLRERGDDIIEIAESFIEKHARKLNKGPVRLDEFGRRLLQSYPWPGNVRELQNIIERAMIMSKDGKLELAPLLSPATAPPQAPAPDRIYSADEFREMEKQNILRALETAGWKISGPRGAAALLGLPATTLNSKIKALEISRNR